MVRENKSGAQSPRTTNRRTTGPATPKSSRTRNTGGKEVKSSPSKGTKKAPEHPFAPEQKNRPRTRRQSDGKGRYMVAICIVIVALLVMGAIISFFSVWKSDQSIVSFDYIFNRDVVARNNMGKIGAIIANLLVGDFFGIFALALPFAMLTFSAMIFKIKPLFCRKATVSLLLLTMTGSIAAAYFAPASKGLYGSSLGGAWGLYCSDWLQNLVGIDGAALVVVLLLALWLTYTSLAIVKYFGKTIKGFFIVVFKILSLLGGAIASWVRRPQRPKVQRPVGQSEELPFKETPENEPVYTIAKDDAIVLPDEMMIEQEEEPSFDPMENEGFIAPSRTISEGTTQGFVPFSGFEDDDDDMVLTSLTEKAEAEKEVVIEEEKRDEETPDDNQNKIDNQDVELIIEAPKPSEQTTPQPTEPTFTIDDLFNEEEVVVKVDDEAKFEISITDNAQIIAENLPDDVVVTTNDSEEAQEIEMEVYDPTKELSSFKLPSVDLLDNHTSKVVVTEQELYENKNKIVETLKNFSIAIDKIKATIGPTVTLYEIKPSAGVRISKIKNLEDDIALSLSALGIRIIAPIPGKGTIGIEVPNTNKEVVSMHSVIKSAKFQESNYDLPIVLGRTIQNEDFVIDLAKMPHLLVAGATGQGKSVGLNAIITSLLYKKHPAELKFVLVDPKKVELTLYSSLEKHYLAKMSSEDESIITDTDKVVYTLNSLCIEMDARYLLLKNAKTRNIKEYNAKFTSRRLSPLNGHRYLPYFVVIIDEFADLIMTAGREIETPIARIAQLARAVGIHLVIATQRPTTNIITGVIKANFPARIAFRVSSMIDSRTILDQPGANQLIGRGDMLVSSGSEVVRVQCAFVDTPEVERITDFIGGQRGYSSAYELPDYVPESDKKNDVGNPMPSKLDEKFTEVARYVVQNQQGSASTIQRNFNIGFNRAGRLMDQLERAGIVGRQEGSKPRQVLISDMASLEVKLYDMENNNEFNH